MILQTPAVQNKEKNTFIISDTVMTRLEQCFLVHPALGTTHTLILP